MIHEERVIGSKRIYFGWFTFFAEFEFEIMVDKQRGQVCIITGSITTDDHVTCFNGKTHVKEMPEHEQGNEYHH
jgi:hypothetical protein